MAKADIANYDASTRASSELQAVIRQESNRSAAPKISVESALKQPRVVTSTVKRTATRVLFISQDDSLLNPETQTLDGFLNLSDMFEEVHIVILREGIPSSNPVLRAAPNVWVYTATAKQWFMTPKAAIDLIYEQLVFAAGLRPDLIVARDPFESALVAAKIGAAFDKPTQLHILEDYSSPDFLKKSRHNRWRKYLPLFTVRKFQSVRVLTEQYAAVLRAKFTIKDLQTLPRFQDYQSIIDAKPTLDLKEKYKPFIFFMLYVGALTHESTAFRAIDAARFALKNPRIGLVILGDGPARPEFERRVKILGIEKQVVFERSSKDIISYLKGAHVLVATDTDAKSDDVILQAAAAGLPMVMARTPIRTNLFEEGVSAYLCEETDTQGFTDRIHDLLNNIGYRQIFKENARSVITEKFHFDPNRYKTAYQTSVEEAFFVDTDSAEE